MQVKLRHLLWLVPALAACGPQDPNKPPAKYRLEGSLTQVMDLGYDLVRVQPSVNDVSVLFVRLRPIGGDSPTDGGTTMEPAGMSEDYPFKIAFDLRGQPVPTGVRVDLAEEDMNMNQRGACSRNVLNDPRKTFPRLVRGTLFLDRELMPDMPVQGDFNVTFENGIEAASGRTVFVKSFDARVVP